ncbi:RRM domain-containing protein [Mycena chlorophos]|uniref:RRM domain-containing protein n=1 Tax=Mycena chlorophos TaxID=658473 RepID=A0A8H6RZR5_MYCCL|nr:RRM domain-containing protein [Mycena chlorophos]
MSKVVFVGNVPYKITEDTLIDVFKSVGQVVALRLVFDRETGKPKGYGFCEFADHATALSAVRNLNNVDVGGRSLRIDLADSDPLLEGKTTVRGEIIDSGWRGNHDDVDGTAEILASVPPGKPLRPGQRSEDAVKEMLRERSPGELNEILAQLKALSFTHPKEMTALLKAHPQLAYAIYSGLSLSGLLPPDAIHHLIVPPNNQGRGPPPPMQSSYGNGPPPPAFSPAPGAYNAYQPGPPRPPSQPPLAPMYGHPGMPPQQTPPPPVQHGYGAMPPYQNYGRPMPPPAVPNMMPPPPIPGSGPSPYPPQPPPAQPQQPATTTSDQQAALAVILSLNPEQLSALSAEDRAMVEQFRNGMIR